MPESLSRGTEEFGKKSVRFVVTLVGLLILRGLVSVLPMLKNAGAIDSTFLSPLVIANAAVDTLILIALVGFGFAASRALGRSYPRSPDLNTAVILVTVLLVLVLAYNLFELPLACTFVSSQDILAGDAQNAAQLRAFAQQLELRHMLNQAQLDALKNASGDTLMAYQKLAVFKFRESPDVYGWAFLALCAIPIVGLVTLGYRNLDRITEALFKKAKQPSGAFQQNVRPEIPLLRCKDCGHPMSLDVKFCPECGAQRVPMAVTNEQRCPACGAQNSSMAKFCKECGRVILADLRRATGA